MAHNPIPSSMKDYTKPKKSSKKKSEAKETKQHEEQECAEMIQARKGDSQKYLRQFQTPFQEYYSLYRSIPNLGRQNYKGRANLFVPYVFSTIETVMPRLTANQPKPMVTPRNPESLTGSTKLQKVVDYYLDRMKFKAIYKDWVREMLMYGTSIAKVTWKYDNDYDGPHLELVDLAGDEIFFDPSQPDINSKDNWWIHEFKQTCDEVKNNKNYTLEDPELIMGDDFGDTDTADYYKDFRDFISGISPVKDSKAKKCLIQEYWGPYEDKKGDMKQYIITVMMKKYIIRKELNPYPFDRPPFVAITDIKLAHEPIGIGEIEPIVSLQYELNDTRNQRMDNVTLAMNNMWLVNKGADVEESEMVSRPGGIIHASDISGVTPLVTPDMTRSAYNEETLIKSDIQIATGINDMASNVGSKNDTNASNSTVRGMAMQQEMSNARFQLKLDNIEDGVILFGEMLLQMIQKFMPNDLIIKLKTEQGYQFKQLSKAEIKGEYDFKVEMGATQPMNKLTRRAEARDLIATVAPYLQVMPDGQAKMAKYMKFLESTYDMPEDTDQGPGMPQPNQQTQPQMGSTPGQAGLNLAPNEAQLGQLGAQLGGSPAGGPAPEIKGMGPLNPMG